MGLLLWALSFFLTFFFFIFFFFSSSLFSFLSKSQATIGIGDNGCMVGNGLYIYYALEEKYTRIGIGKGFSLYCFFCLLENIAFFFAFCLTKGVQARHQKLAKNMDGNMVSAREQSAHLYAVFSGKHTIKRRPIPVQPGCLCFGFASQAWRLSTELRQGAISNQLHMILIFFSVCWLSSLCQSEQ